MSPPKGHSPTQRRLFVAAFALATGLVGAGSLLLAYTLWLGSPVCGGAFCSDFRPYLPVIGAAGLIRSGLFLSRRHHENRTVAGAAEDVVHAVSEAALGSLAIVVFTFLWRGGTAYRAYSYGRGVFIADWIIATVVLAVLLVVLRRTLERLRDRGHNLRNVAVVGDSSAADDFVRSISEHPETGYRVVARVRDPGTEEGGLARELLDITTIEHLDEVILATPDIPRSEIFEVVATEELRGVEVRAVPALFGLPPKKVLLESVGDHPLLSLLQEPLSPTHRAIKRSIDFAGALGGLVALSPVMLCAAAAVRLTSRGEVLFRQTRVGMDGRPFEMLKFRTMRQGADTKVHEEFVTSIIQGGDTVIDLRDGEPIYKLSDDPRITPVGRILRKLSIDELPQLINVLKGEMSLVGPRPALPIEVAVYEEWHRRRLDVRPGMTGLWQVSGRSRMSFEDMVKLDSHYIETWSLVQDLTILLRTIPAVLRREAG